MKKTKLNQSVLVALSAQSTADNFAVLAAELKTNEQGLIQLLPYGHFNSVDGRPADVPSKQWLMDKQAFESLKANSTYAVNDLVIDYEHQTLKAEQNGQPAIAAGYFHINDIQFIEGKGLFIKPRWNEKAKAHLSAGEYKYISAVFGYDKQTGRPQFLHSAGLVNRPGLDGMEPLAQLAAKQFHSNTNHTHNYKEDNAVNPILLAILKALGIKVNGDLPTEPAALSALQTQVDTALAALQAKADSVPGLTTQITALSAGGVVDPSKYVPIAAVTELQQSLATLQAQVTGGEVEGLVSLGMSEGKILASMKPWATELGNQDVAQLKAFLAATPAIAALKGKQTENTNLDDNNENDVTALSADDKEAAKMLGIDETEFAKQKAADNLINNKGAK